MNPSSAEYRVLLVEDNPGDVELIKDIIDGDHIQVQSEAVDTLKSACDLVRSKTFDAVLLDLGLPDGNGIECVHGIRNASSEPAIIVLTGLDNEKLALECLAIGAQDYINKNEVRPHDLRRAIGYAIARVREASARTEVERLHSRLAAIVGASIDAIVSWDASGVVTSWNKGAELILGISAIEAIGSPLDRNTPMYRGAGNAGLSNNSFEVSRTTTSGEKQLLYVTSFEMPAGDDGYGGMGAIIRDVTEVRSAEARRREIEHQLWQSQKMQALGTLAGGIAHDLGNVLVPILGIPPLLLEMVDEPEQREMLEIIERSAGRANGLVKQVLNFSRQGNGERVPLSLGVLIQDSLKLLQASFRASIEIRANVQSDELMIGDEDQLYQVILNLVTNAAQAIGNSRGTISLDVRNESASEICLVVSDDGPGMSRETQKKIFEPFFTTKKSTEGTGLGLSVVSGIVRDHGGTIDLYSEVDRGTIFEIRFPKFQGNACV